MLALMAGRAKVVRSSAHGTRWEIATRPLPDALHTFVHGMMGYVESSPGVVSQRQLPGPRVVVIVELGPPIRMSDPRLRDARFPGGFVAGVGDFVTVTEHDGFQSGIQIDLTPVGARALFGVPMDELAGAVVSLSDLLPRQERSLAERLDAMPDWDARFDALEALLVGSIERMTARSAIVAWACARIDAARGGLDMRALARELGYSEKQVVRLFRDQVGLAPKLFARLSRFDQLVQRLRSGRDASWSELANELGYYDQAHLVREVRHFAGTTPTAARNSLLGLVPDPH
jgi:AraC-like DNA-binding protein